MSTRIRYKKDVEGCLVSDRFVAGTSVVVAKINPKKNEHEMLEGFVVNQDTRTATIFSDKTLHGLKKKIRDCLKSSGVVLHDEVRKGKNHESKTSSSN